MSIFKPSIFEQRYFAKHNLLNQIGAPKPPMTNPKDIAYLLNKKRHKKDPRFRKSSVVYWLPLMIALILLYCFF